MRIAFVVHETCLRIHQNAEYVLEPLPGTTHGDEGCYKPGRKNMTLGGRPLASRRPDADGQSREKESAG